MFFLDLLFNRPKCRPGYMRPQKASTIPIGGCIVIKNRPCEVKTVEQYSKHVNYSFEKTRDISYSFKLKFVARDVFTWKEYTHIVKADAYCEVPIVYDAEYEITDISEDGRLSLITQNGEVRGSLSLDRDCHPELLPWCIRMFSEGKLLFAGVKLAMGKEQVCYISQRGKSEGTIMISYPIISPFGLPTVLCTLTLYLHCYN